MLGGTAKSGITCCWSDGGLTLCCAPPDRAPRVVLRALCRLRNMRPQRILRTYREVESRILELAIAGQEPLITTMTKQLARQLEKVTIPEDDGRDDLRILDELFDALNDKLLPIGLHIASANVGFDTTIPPREIFAQLKGAKLV